MNIFLILTLLTVTAFAAGPTKEELQAALEQNPSDKWALYNLGMANYLEEDFGGAIEHWSTLKSSIQLTGK